MEDKKTIEKLVYSCGYCGKLYYEKFQADECHADRTCRTCGKVIGKKDYWVDCQECRNKVELEKEKKSYDKAEKISYEEYVKRFPDNMIFYNDKYYSELEDLKDDIDEEDEMPKYIWGTRKEVVGLDYSDIIENHEEGIHLEEFETDRDAVEELKEFCEQWNAKHATTVYWQSDDIVILL